MICSPRAFLDLSGKLLAEKETNAATQQVRNIGGVEGQIVDAATAARFRSSYGISHDVCSHTWELMAKYGTMPAKAMPKHLLWSLMYMKTYESEIFLSSLFGVSDRCFRKWIWLMIASIGQLYDKVVSRKKLEVNYCSTPLF